MTDEERKLYATATPEMVCALLDRAQLAEREANRQCARAQAAEAEVARLTQRATVAEADRAAFYEMSERKQRTIDKLDAEVAASRRDVDHLFATSRTGFHDEMVRKLAAAEEEVARLRERLELFHGGERIMAEDLKHVLLERDGLRASLREAPYRLSQAVMEALNDRGVMDDAKPGDSMDLRRHLDAIAQHVISTLTDPFIDDTAAGLLSAVAEAREEATRRGVVIEAPPPPVPVVPPLHESPAREAAIDARLSRIRNDQAKADPSELPAPNRLIHEVCPRCSYMHECQAKPAPAVVEPDAALVERVAKALFARWCDENGDLPDGLEAGWRDVTEDDRASWRLDARAALAALASGGGK